MSNLFNVVSGSKEQLFKNAKQKLINKNYNEIYAHEAAHKNAAGAFGGSIHIVKNGDGIPVAGFVPISVPVVPNTNNPKILDKVISQAKTVIKAAMAPSDPSKADFKVKSGAEALIKQAEHKKQQKTINYIA